MTSTFKLANNQVMIMLPRRMRQPDAATSSATGSEAVACAQCDRTPADDVLANSATAPPPGACSVAMPDPPA